MTSRSVLLIHGWLGGPESFGDLARILEADGHRVVPVFQHYDTLNRRVTIETHADRLEEALARAQALRDGPLVVLAHSMGGLLIRSWMVRHHLAKGRPAPVELVIEAGSPRHGVPGDRLGNLLVRWRILPGAGQVGQMQALHPFLQDLIRREFELQAAWPPVVGLTSFPRHPDWRARWMGGAESDVVVPAVLSNPNAQLARLGAPVQTLAGRPFRVFHGWVHNGPRGLLGHIRATASGAPADPQDEPCRMLRELIRSGNPAACAPYGQDGNRSLRRTFVSFRPARPETGRPHACRLLLQARDGSWRPLKPLQASAEGGAFFEATGERPAEPNDHNPVPFALLRGDSRVSCAEFGLPEGLTPGTVLYLEG